MNKPSHRSGHTRIVAGPHGILESLAQQKRSKRTGNSDSVQESGGIVEIWLDAAHPRKDLEQAAERAGVPVRRVPAEELQVLAQGLRHQGAVALAGRYPYVSLETLLEGEATPRLLALDELTDPHNVGAILRSAIAFGVTGVILPKRRAAHITPAVVRVSAGASEHARVALVTNLAQTLSELRERGIVSLGLAAEGNASINDLPEAPHGQVLVVGAEGRGLRRLVRERCDHLISIPMAGPIASLNASVAAGIALYAMASRF